MKILVIGSGGREHAIVWKIAQSKKVEKIFCAPGNPGIVEIAECVNIKADDIEELKAFAIKEGIDLTVVGPEQPLAMGIVDEFEKAGLKIFGPSKNAAEIEGSKAFSKDLMQKYNIPTAAYKVFENADDAKEYAEKHHPPVVVKADGLAAGKGVFICPTMDETFLAVDIIMKEKAFGDAGNRVVIEEFLAGEEASFLAFTDGETVLPLASAQDHKAVYDDDKGPNTGGMGAYSPAPIITPSMQKKVMDEIMLPIVNAMRAEGRIFKGVLYAGLMLTKKGPKVLEFNARFGDPETQPILMRLKTDIVALFMAAIENRLKDIKLEWDKKTAVCVVMASEGYPGDYEKGKVINGLDNLKDMKDVFVFHAGTSVKDGRLVTNGGRVLGVTAIGTGIKRAIKNAYTAVEKINWDGVHYRRDIGAKAVSSR
ncbi:MAG: phosphoribosylamine--glycine ligase [Deltaproteobacteria bacterium]|nr:phosphoribosylamine--glycine ligase [Deltaproteobacteria bacterium]